MKLKTFIFAAALLTSNAAFAQSSGDSARDQLAGMGYTNIQVERSGDTYSIEAYRDGQKREITYNALTGEILSDVSRRETRGTRVVRNAHVVGGNSGSNRSNDNDSNDNDDRGGNDNDDRDGHDNDDRGGNDNDDRDGHNNDNDD